MTQTELYDKLDEVTAERDALASRLDGYEKAFAYLEAHVFERKWDGTLGRPFTWHMAGPYRHELAKWKGDSLIDALSSLVVEIHDPWKCGECGAQFAEQLDLASHMSVKHRL